jgi:competence protein ComFC
MRALGPPFGNGTTWPARWGRFRSALLDLVLPQRCGGCDHIGSLWCAVCHSTVRPVCDPVCPHCGRPQRSDDLCSQCRHTQRLHGIDGIRSAVVFEGPLRQAIHHLKYSGRSSLAEPLGDYMVARWQAGPLPADLIVPVPLHTARLRERGYNQSTLLARRLSNASALPVVEGALARIRATAPQITLNAAEREANVRDAFEARAELVISRRVLLVDDVCTTGATLAACSRALKAAGATSVWALTLARAP